MLPPDSTFAQGIVIYARLASRPRHSTRAAHHATPAQEAYVFEIAPAAGLRVDVRIARSLTDPASYAQQWVRMRNWAAQATEGDWLVLHARGMGTTPDGNLQAQEPLLLLTRTCNGSPIVLPHGLAALGKRNAPHTVTPDLFGATA